jgi:hypothetical protein
VRVRHVLLQGPGALLRTKHDPYSAARGTASTLATQHPSTKVLRPDIMPAGAHVDQQTGTQYMPHTEAQAAGASPGPHLACRSCSAPLLLSSWKSRDEMALALAKRFWATASSVGCSSHVSALG